MKAQFDLPAEFLKNGCKLLGRKISPEAEVEYARSEKDCVSIDRR
jgi:hypothetical protein